MLIKKEKKCENNTTQSYILSVKEYMELNEQDRRLWSPIKAKYERTPWLAKASFLLLAISLIIYIVAEMSPQFADFFNIYISSVIRFLLAKITNLFPFSLAEAIVILIPIIAFILLWYLFKFRCESKKSAKVSTLLVLSLASVFLSTFILSFGIGYKGTELDEKLELSREPISAQELYHTADYLISQINELAEKIQFGEDDFSTMPYSFAQMNQKLLDAYDSFCDEHDFIINYNSRLKPIMLSEPMSYTHITGVYTFFTGESNINVNFPDYTIPYTAAHELAHQRGISREDEANMVAFLICSSSEDEYVQYCAYLNMYEYVSSALYSANKDLYREVRSKLAPEVYEEQLAYSAFFKKYSKSVASKVTGTVNDVYLKAQGTVGKKSYGMVVDLTVAYFKQQGIIQ